MEFCRIYLKLSSGTSNHSIKYFDSTLRRRVWFALFGTYYHTANPQQNIKEYTPFMDFGKNLFHDWDEKEWNMFYNLMAQCLKFYLQVKRRIDPPMESVENRIIERSIGADFIYWADEYFTTDRLNVNVPDTDAYNDYKAKTNHTFTKKAGFTKKIMQYAAYKKYIYNPDDLIKYNDDKKSHRIRVSVMGSWLNMYHLRTDSNKITAD